MRRRAAAGAATIAAAALLAGCGSSSPSSDGQQAKSPDAYCEAFFSHAAPLHDKYVEASQAAKSEDLLGYLPTMLSTPGDMASLFDSMSAHAPDEIAGDTAAARDAFRKIQDNLADHATDPLGALASNLVTSATTSGSFERIGAYLQAHCPMDSTIAKKYVHKTPAAAVTTDTEPNDNSATNKAADATAPEPGTDLVKLDGTSGRLSVITNGKGFTLIRSVVDFGSDDDTNDDESSITTYDAAGNELTEISGDTFTGECGVSDLMAGDRRIVVSEQITNTPAQGIVPAKMSAELDAWDAVTGDQVWTVQLASDEKGNGSCSGDDGKLGLGATHDGKWGVWQRGEGGTIIIDLATGDTHEDRRTLQVLGNYLFQRHEYSGEKSPIVDPESGKTLATIEDEHLYSDIDVAPSGMFESISDGSSAPAGLASDGTHFFLTQDEDGDSRVTSYSLPDAKVAWRASTKLDANIIGDAGGVLLTTGDDADGDSQLIGLDDATGEQLWAVPDGEVCGITDNELLVMVNGQRAYLDMHTGEQKLYSDPDNDNCIDLQPGGIQVVSGSEDPTEPHSIQVRQVLRP